jgi:hypothetical protein
VELAMMMDKKTVENRMAHVGQEGVFGFFSGYLIRGMT